MMMMMMVMEVDAAELSEQCSLDDYAVDDYDFYLAPVSALQSYLNSVTR